MDCTPGDPVLLPVINGGPARIDTSKSLLFRLAVSGLEGDFFKCLFDLFCCLMMILAFVLLFHFPASCPGWARIFRLFSLSLLLFCSVLLPSLSSESTVCVLATVGCVGSSKSGCRRHQVVEL